MPQKVDVKVDDVYNENDIVTKYISLRIGSGKYIPLLPAVNPYKIKSATLSSLQDVPIENYIPITLEQLRLMDSSQEKQRAFINEKLCVDSGHTSFFVARLLVKGDQKIEHKDIEYIVDLLNFPSNDLMVVPTIYHYYTTKPTEKFPYKVNKPTDPLNAEDYLAFVKSFISVAKERGVEHLGLMFQSNLDYNSTDKLLSLYKDSETKIAFVDGRGNKISELWPQINRLTSKGDGKAYTLREKNGEKFALYSFDAAPYTARREVAPAHNVLGYLYGFSSFGPRHTIRMKFNGKTQKKPNPPRLYNEDEIGYVGYISDTYKNEVKRFDTWFGKTFKDAKSKDPLVSYKKDYEITNLASSISELYSNMDEQKFWDAIFKKPNLEGDIKQIKNMNKSNPG